MSKNSRFSQLDLVFIAEKRPTNKPGYPEKLFESQIHTYTFLCFRGESLLPIMLASYIFESLIANPGEKTPLEAQQDEQLGFEAAVAALGLKANVCEADHPLLCEGTRRQRGDLALLLLVHYKDQPER